jgi:ankyrin repeat protein
LLLSKGASAFTQNN